MTDSIEAENSSGDREPILTPEGRLAALEGAMQAHEDWLIRLDKCKTVFRLEERLKAVSEQIDVLEGRKGPTRKEVRDIQALKAALGALGKHVHLPDGQIGLPLNLNLK